MIWGETVDVLAYDAGAGWTEEAVCNVLPGAPSTEGGTSGAACTSVEFHFPKSWTGALGGRWLRWRGRLYQVLGDPQPLLEELTPGLWNRPAKAVARTYGQTFALERCSAAVDDYGRPRESWEEAWSGRCRECSAEEASAWLGAGLVPEGARIVALLPDPELMSADPAELRAVLCGQPYRISSVSWAGGPGGEIAVAMSERAPS